LGLAKLLGIAAIASLLPSAVRIFAIDGSDMAQNL
jgi:hypothetical protein